MTAVVDERTLDDPRSPSSDGTVSSGAAGSCGGCCFSPTSSAWSPRFLLVGVACRRSASAGGSRRPAARSILIFALSLPAWIVVTKLYGLYDHDEERTDHSTADDVVGVFHMVTVCAWLFFAFALPDEGRSPDACRSFCSSGHWRSRFVSFGRAMARAYCRRHISYLQNTIIVGAGDVGQLVARKLLKHPGVRDQSRRLSSTRTEGAARRPRASDSAWAHPSGSRRSSACSTLSA